MKNKLAVVIPNLHGAGCEKLVSEMLFKFVEEFEIDLILYEKHIDYKIPENINIKLVGTDNSPYHFILYKIFRQIKRIINIGKILKQNNYDAIISFIDGCNTNVLFAKKIFKIKTPLIAAEHTINENFFNNNPFSKRFKIFFKYLSKITYNRVDEVIVISNSMKKYLQEVIKVTNQNITVIYNGIDTNKFSPTKNQNIEFEKEFKEVKIRLLNVARLDDNKNQQYLVNLMPEILKHKPEARLFIIGKGEKEEELKELIKNLDLEDKVFLLGWKTNVADYMRESNLFLMSSKYESFGNVVIESLSCGVPVIISEYDEVVFEILDDSMGEIVKLENKKEYINAILSWLDKDIDKNKMHQKIKEKFSIEITSKKYLEVIKKAIK